MFKLNYSEIICILTISMKKYHLCLLLRSFRQLEKLNNSFFYNKNRDSVMIVKMIARLRFQKLHAFYYESSATYQNTSYDSPECLLRNLCN